MAPTTDPISPAPSPARYQPKACPTHVATKAPMMPSTVVRMKPDGSLSPGMISYAITPATKPMMIVQMIPMADCLLLRQRVARWDGCCGKLAFSPYIN